MSKNSKVGDIIAIPEKEGEYLVEDAKMTGGGTGHGPGDIFPDAWHVYARKLKNGQYDPKGKSVVFSQNTTCHSNLIEGVKVVGKMQKKVTWTRVK